MRSRARTPSKESSAKPYKQVDKTLRGRSILEALRSSAISGSRLRSCGYETTSIAHAHTHTHSHTHTHTRTHTHTHAHAHAHTHTHTRTHKHICTRNRLVPTRPRICDRWIIPQAAPSAGCIHIMHPHQIPICLGSQYFEHVLQDQECPKKAQMCYKQAHGG